MCNFQKGAPFPKTSLTRLFSKKIINLATVASPLRVVENLEDEDGSTFKWLAFAVTQANNNVEISRIFPSIIGNEPSGSPCEIRFAKSFAFAD